MVLVQHDDERAFRLLYERHRRLALLVAERVSHDRGRAAEAVQEGFLAIWRGRAGYVRARGNFRPWLLGVVHNRAVDATRRSRVHSPEASASDSLLASIASADCTWGAVLDSDRAMTLRAAVDSLPPSQRETIELTFYGGLSHTQAARALDVPAGTVKGRVRLGLDRLRHVPTVAQQRDTSFAARGEQRT